MNKSLFMGTALMFAGYLCLSPVLAGPNAHSGANPIISAAGKQTGNASLAIFSGDASHDILITDVILSVRVPQNMLCSYEVLLKDSSGGIVGAFEVSKNHWNASSANSLNASFQGGLKVSAGEDVTMDVNRYSYNGSSCDLYYTISAKKVKP